MDIHVDQRWRERRSFFVAPERRFNPKGFAVEAIADDTTARRFVEREHYLASYPAARWRFGLYAPGGHLVGVAVFSHPTNDKVLSIFPGPARDSVELGRLVLLDEVGFNAETWFLARAFLALRREKLRGVLSFSDPFPRDDVHGAVVHQGHLGTLYKGFNAGFYGLGTARTLHLLPDGTTLNARALSKVRELERGWQYVSRLLQGHGAQPLPIQEGEEHLPGARALAAWWLHSWLPRLTRKRRHPGNLRYAWAFDAEAQRHLPPRQPYMTRAAVERMLARRPSKLTHAAQAA